MTTPILTLAEVQALAGFTEGPWRGDRNDGTIKYTARGPDDRIVLTVDHKNGRYGFCVDESYPSDSVSGEHDADERLFLAAPALYATCKHLFAEVARLTAELGKPAVEAWFGNLDRGDSMRRLAVGAPYRLGLVTPTYWWAKDACGNVIADGTETGAAGMQCVDLALVAAGYRLVGGVFGEVSDAKT